MYITEARQLRFSLPSFDFQELIRANAYIKTAADLETKYRKNVQYNLEATLGTDGESHQASAEK
jgi:hypothetical protein